MSILVCLEDSESTASAVGVALELARSLGVELVGLAVIDEPDILAGAATSIGGAAFRKDRDAAMLDDAHVHARAWLESFVERSRDAGIAARTLELTGRPAQTILEEAEHHRLIVFGRDVNFRFETQEEDRHTRDRILRRAGRPIVVVPAPPVEASSAVIAMYDGSAAASRALRAFAGSGLARGRKVHVATLDDDGANAYEKASHGCELLRREFGITAEPENIVSAAPAVEALLARRTKLSAGLIVLGGYVPSPLARLVWGSVTSGIVEHSPVPVFVHY